jgi:hypothetical protein
MTTETESWLKTDEQLGLDAEEFWRDRFLDPSGQIFQRPHGAGYWLYGVEFSPNIGWLGFEFDEATFDPRDEKRHAGAIEAWNAGRELPAHYFRLDFECAKKAFNVGMRKWGQDWLEDADLPRIDLVLQWTLFGEERYA